MIQGIHRYKGPFKYQKQPTKWSCVPTSFGMCLNIPVDEILKKIGHDGSQIIYPDLIEPLRRRGFHPQELIKVCYDYNYTVTTFEVEPILINSYNYQYSIGSDEKYILEIMKDNIGISCGYVKDKNIPHSVAWDGKHMLDPSNDLIYTIDNFNVELFYLINRKNTVPYDSISEENKESYKT